MNNKAFTLFEVLLAIGMLTLAVFVIANLELRSLLRVLRDRDDIEKTFLVKKELYYFYLNPPQQLGRAVKKIENLEMSLTTAVDVVATKSSLASLQDRLNKVSIVGAWKQEKVSRQLTMVAFTYKPLSQQEKEKA